MKAIILLAAILFTSIPALAQQNSNVTYEVKGDLTEATYFYEDGSIEQHGAFNKLGKLHGVWTSYDINGDKLSVGNYENGIKVGKWLFWTNDTLNEVEYSNSRLVSVNQWKNKSKLVIRN